MAAGRDGGRRVGGERVRSPEHRQDGRQQSHDEFVRIRAQRDVAGRIVQQPAPARADLVGNRRGPFPLLVDERRRIQPCLLLRIKGYVGPGLMRMAGEEQSIGDAKPGIVARQAYRCERISHKSGKSGEPTVVRR